MQIGWIDFSKEDRKKVLSVIDLLSEDSTLDELGIAPVRDGFSDLFFPGTSTIQTRAKYFLIVPYALDMLTHQKEMQPDAVLNDLDYIERRCGELFVAEKAERSIGSRSIQSGRWVKRAPSEIYWSGLRRYNIFTGGVISLAEYIRVSCALTKKKNDLRWFGNRKIDSEEYEKDDIDAGASKSFSFWNLPTYPSDWMDNLTMKLSHLESEFLKAQIESSVPYSMMAYILKNELRQVSQMDEFLAIGEHGVIKQFPDAMVMDYQMALYFSEFIYGARIRYNVILSEGKNTDANNEWEMYQEYLSDVSAIDIDAIFYRLRIVNPMLKRFLESVREQMRSRDINALDECIINREIQLKGKSRAKLTHAGEFPLDNWIGGGRLEYRFGNAMMIVRDIFQGLGEGI